MPIPMELQTLELEVYTAAWCPDCRRLDRWLAAEGLELRQVDIREIPGAAERLERETGKRGIPYLLVDGKRWVRGYHREVSGGFDPVVLVKELLEAARA